MGAIGEALWQDRSYHRHGCRAQPLRERLERLESGTALEACVTHTTKSEPCFVDPRCASPISEISVAKSNRHPKIAVLSDSCQ